MINIMTYNLNFQSTNEVIVKDSRRFYMEKKV